MVKLAMRVSSNHDFAFIFVADENFQSEILIGHMNRNIPLVNDLDISIIFLFSSGYFCKHVR